MYEKDDLPEYKTESKRDPTLGQHVGKNMIQNGEQAGRLVKFGGEQIKGMTQGVTPQTHPGHSAQSNAHPVIRSNRTSTKAETFVRPDIPYSRGAPSTYSMAAQRPTQFQGRLNQKTHGPMRAFNY
jgi:hypothetical protein